jgi:hypothetical protein
MGDHRTRYGGQGGSLPQAAGLAARSAPAPGFGFIHKFANGGQRGTDGTPYRQTQQQETQYTATSGSAGQPATITYKCITKMPAYETKSFEELRFEDYAKGNFGAAEQSLSKASLVDLAARGLWARCHVRLDDGMFYVDERNEVRT